MAATDALPIPQKNVAYRITAPILDADGDLVTAAAGLDSEVSIDAGTFADVIAEATEIATSSGMYYLDLTAAEMNGDTIAVIIKTTTSGAKTTPIVMYPEEAGNIRVNVTQISGDATAADNEELFFDGTGYAAANSTVGTVTAVTTVNGLAAGVVTAAAIATGAVDADALATDAVAEIADGVWDEAMAGHLTVGTYGQVMRGLGLTGEVNDLAASTTVFIVDGFTEATADHFNGSVIVFTSGAAAGQARVIVDYSATTQSITLGEALTDAPADNDDFVIMPMGVFLGGTLSQIARLFITILNTTGQLDAGSLTAGTIDAAAIANGAIDAATFAAGAIDAAAIANGAIDAATFAAGAIDAAAIATGAVDADAIAADAVDEFWDEAMVESAAVPAVTASFRAALQWIFALSRNKITQTSTTQALRNDADLANIGTAAVSDDGTTATRAEWA